MMEKRVTKRDVLNHIIETYATDTMVVEYAKHEIELLDNKKSNKTETKTQKENVVLMETIVNTLTDLARPVRITELQEANSTLAELSNQKVSALLKKLVDNKTINKTIDKKVAYFSM